MFREIRETTSDCLRREEKKKKRARNSRYYKKNCSENRCFYRRNKNLLE